MNIHPHRPHTITYTKDCPQGMLFPGDVLSHIKVTGLMFE